jgi:hypothetical protein
MNFVNSNINRQAPHQKTRLIIPKEVPIPTRYPNADARSGIIGRRSVLNANPLMLPVPWKYNAVAMYCDESGYT